jgi:putative polyketide hydroxylase
MSNLVDEVPVLITGAGPVGLAMSLLLSRHGVASMTIDKRSEISPLPRARGVHARAMEILRGCGVESDLRAAELPITPGAVFLPRLTASPSRVMRIGSAEEDAISPSEGLAISQDIFEGVLFKHARRREPAQLLRGVRLTSFVTDESGILASVLETATGTHRQIRARYLVAADGASSGIRRQLGIPMRGPADVGQRVSIWFRADLRRWTGTHPMGIYQLQDTGAVLIWTHQDHRWTLVAMPGATDTDTDPIDVVRGAIGVTDLHVEIRGTSRWTATAQWATKNHCGPVFLIGDAAHRYPPAGATGISTGIADAQNLAWKMAAVLAGRSGPDLLSTYGAERVSVAHRNAVEMLGLWYQFAGPRGPALDAPLRSMRQVDMGYQYRSDITLDDGSADADPPGADYVPTTAPGCRAPHIWVDGIPRGRSTIDLFDTEFTVLCGPPGTATWTRAADIAGTDLGIPVTAHPVTNPSWGPLYGVHASGAVLVRPDGHVAWRHPDAANPTTAARSLTHALAAASRSNQDPQRSTDVAWSFP